MSNGAQPASGGATYRMLRELGSRSQRSYAAIREPHELVVAQRFVRLRGGVVVAGTSAAETATALDGESMALLLRDARCLAKNWHANIARVRHVDLAGPDRPELTIASELLDGATLADLLEAAPLEPHEPHEPRLPLPVLVRILVDVLTGAHALHHLRDGMNAPLGAMHGELCPANVVVGKDGVARIVNVLRRRPVQVGARSEALGYAAPEALDAGGTDDPRADIYAVGVMLWEGITGQRLYVDRHPAVLLARQREEEVGAPALPPSSPFARLADVAMRALAFDPALRFRTAADMATELRTIAGASLASGSAVASRVAELAGDRIRMRRATLDPALSGTRRRASAQSTTTRGSGTVKASPRIVVPTLEAEIPIALIAASRPTLVDPVRAAQALDEDDLPGPRGSSPALDGVEALALLQLGEAGAAPEPQATGIEATRHLIRSALAATTAKMRAVALERAASPAPPLPSTGTPGDFVIPIDVTETLHEGASRARTRRGLALVACAAAIVLLAMGSFVALRAGAPARSTTVAAPSPSAPPPPATGMEGTPPPEATAIFSTPAVRTTATASPVVPADVAPAATGSADAAPGAAAGGPGRVTPRPPAAAPAAKPKRSVYDPDGL